MRFNLGKNLILWENSHAKYSSEGLETAQKRLKNSLKKAVFEQFNLLILLFQLVSCFSVVELFGRRLT